MPLKRTQKYSEVDVDILVAQAQQGDREAFGKLYDTYVDQLYRYVFYKVPEPDVPDVTEQIFLKAWEHLASYKKLDYSFSAWLFRIARNHVIDFYRMRKEVASLNSDAPLEARRVEENPAAKLERSLTNIAVKKALSLIQESYQQVLILKFINEFSNEEVARILGKTEGAVRVLQFRALGFLKKQLEAMGICDFTG